MPKLSDTMTEGTLVAWKKKKGDKVTMGEVIAEVETDKATMEMEAFEDGVLTEIYVPEGGKVAVGERLAMVGDELRGGRSRSSVEKGRARSGAPCQGRPRARSACRDARPASGRQGRGGRPRESFSTRAQSCRSEQH